MRAHLEAALADNDAQLRDLERQHAEIVAASRESNADDEHDPEGATIAFERQQVLALLESCRRTRTDILRALEVLDGDGYGSCERCGGPIGDARLQARPTARTCIDCASRRR
ncbi:MAG: TraR/DksA family transcriptional regulator [Mycobacteriales bacterium]